MVDHNDQAGNTKKADSPRGKEGCLQTTVLLYCSGVDCHINIRFRGDCVLLRWISSFWEAFLSALPEQNTTYRLLMSPHYRTKKERVVFLSGKILAFPFLRIWGLIRVMTTDTPLAFPTNDERLSFLT